MEATIKQAVADHAAVLFGTDVDANLIQFQKTRREFAGDTTLVLFPFIKLAGKSPAELGQTIGSYLKDELKLIQNFSIVGGFLNIVYPPVYWTQLLRDINADANFGLAAPGSKSAVMVEYSSPNTNKPLHLGHLRNNFLGYSVAEILKAVGHKVIKTQIINDRGIHICKSMLAWRDFSPLNGKGERETPANTGLKGDKLVGKYYVVFDAEMSKQATELAESWANGSEPAPDAETQEKVEKLAAARSAKLSEPASEERDADVKSINSKLKDLAKNHTDIIREAQNMLVRWEARDPETYLMWQTMNGWVYEGFNQTYQQMGVDFDQLYYESDTYILGKDIVQEGLEKGVFYRKDDGSVWIDLTGDKLDHKLVQRSDGTSVYITQDMGTAVERFKDFPDLKGMVYTVGNEQDYHFQVLFLILKKLGYEWADNLYHLSYGMVDLPEGKMKSREGTVVDADDLMAETVQNAKEMTQERGHIEGMSDEDRKSLYNMIGMGGLKYFLLKVDPKKRILFNPQKTIELQGDTGPFIQYTHARIKSLLNKLGEPGSFDDVEMHDSELELVKLLSEFPKALDEAATSYSPAQLANYIFELVKQYNQFYQSVNISNEENSDKKAFRLTLSKNVAKVIKAAMYLLGIDVPERM